MLQTMDAALEIKPVPTGVPKPSSSGRILELDGLRGFAVLIVVLYHYIGQANNSPAGSFTWHFQRLFSLGWTGVDLFFVLSGFLIGGILLEARDSPTYYRTFYVRRFHRIIPLFYVWLTLYLIVSFVARGHLPAIAQAAGYSPEPRGWYVWYYLFLQNIKSIHSWLGAAFLGATWSLAVEEQFYLVAPLTVRRFSPRTLGYLLCGVIVAAPLARMAIFAHVLDGRYMNYYLMPTRADSLGFGVLMALIWRSEKCRLWLSSHLRVLFAGLIVLLLGMGVLFKLSSSQFSFGMQSVGYTWLGLFYSCILLLLLVNPSGKFAAVARWSFLRDIGTISYCVYVIHVAIIMLCHQGLLHAQPEIHDLKGVAVTVLAALLTYGVAQLSWAYFERPLVRLGHSYRY